MVAVICLLWVRAIILNTYFREDSIQIARSVGSFLSTAAFYGIINLIILFFLFYWSGGKLKMLGWRKEGFVKHLGIGVLFGLAMLAQHYLITSPLISRFVSSSASQGADMSVLLSDWSMLPFWILMAILKGGFEEELWRSFEINSFQRVLGKYGPVFGLLLGSAVFGLQHIYQGMDTVLSTGLDGLLYGLIYLRKRSVIEAMAAHAVYDIVSIIAGYILL